jgi:hypothetical protein
MGGILPTSARAFFEHWAPGAGDAASPQIESKVVVLTITTSAQNFTIELGAPAAGQMGQKTHAGRARFAFQSRGAICYVRFRPRTAGAAGTTTGAAGNGWAIYDSAVAGNVPCQEFWIDNESCVIDVIGSAGCSLAYYQCSPNYDNARNS